MSGYLNVPLAGVIGYENMINCDIGLILNFWKANRYLREKRHLCKKVPVFESGEASEYELCLPEFSAVAATCAMPLLLTLSMPVRIACT